MLNTVEQRVQLCKSMTCDMSGYKDMDAPVSVTSSAVWTATAVAPQVAYIAPLLTAGSLKSDLHISNR